MLNIVFVIESLQCGGAEKSLTTLLQNFDFTKYKVDLILFNKGGEFEKFIPKEVNVIYKPHFGNTNFLTKLLKRIQFWNVKKHQKNKNYHGAQLYWKVFGSIITVHTKKYDVALAYNQGFSTYYVAEKVTALRKFSWLNTDYNKAGYNINFDYKYYSNFNRIVCVSKECELSLQNEAAIVKKTLPTTIIKDISDELLISKMSLENNGLNKENNTIKLLTVGRLAKAKGYTLAIGACKILIDKGKNIKWYVIGSGPELENIEKLIVKSGVRDHFILLGYRENPYPYIKTCDIYVQTSLFEGLGLTVIEAAILKKPIVTTNFPTASGIITHNETGLICDMTTKAIANNIELLINDECLINKFIKNLSKIKNQDKTQSLIKIKELLSLNYN
ncbi:glycosyltransferase [Mariniflexile gromovii]|uniref:Glycosyltransferase n=1 Tax=Mariniflexile gromovii TaxID=362523 RepID=A0ABS4BPE9_9FLAO|nr:glycosyltransferase [Mariniflexile gromovii]MBP0902469.1 glycosyltransferase [Mariniflexile gromovii]